MSNLEISIITIAILSINIFPNIDLDSCIYILSLLVIYKTFSIILQEDDKVIALIIIATTLFVIVDVFCFLNFFNLYTFFISGKNTNYLACITPFILGVAIKLSITSNKSISALAFVCFCMLIVLIIISGSRGSFCTAIVTSCIVANHKLLIFKRIKRHLGSLNYVRIGALLLATAGFWVLYLLISHDINSILGRILIYQVGSKMFIENWLTGVGAGNFKNVYNNYQAIFLTSKHLPVAVKILADDTFYSFNEVMQFIIEVGILGIFPILSLFLIFIRSSKNNESMDIQAFASFNSLVVIAIQSMYSYPFHVPMINLYCVFFAAVYFNKIKMTCIRTIKFGRIGLLTLSGMWGGYCFMQIRSQIDIIRWNEAIELSLEGRFLEANKIYTLLYPRLNKNGNFLYNYGSELFVVNHYTQSLALLEDAKKIISHSNLYMYLGLNYSKIGRYEDARKCYLHCISMVPSRFMPKYLLFQLYRKNNKVGLAKQIAKEIIFWPVKVPSNDVNRIKESAKVYLETN